jgi:hypothetical protein
LTLTRTSGGLGADKAVPLARAFDDLLPISRPMLLRSAVLLLAVAERKPRMKWRVPQPRRCEDRSTVHGRLWDFQRGLFI